jgi:hypothetical protein
MVDEVVAGKECPACACAAAATDPSRDLPPILSNRRLLAGGDERVDPDVDPDHVTALTGFRLGKLDPNDEGLLRQDAALDQACRPRWGAGQAGRAKLMLRDLCFN